MPLRSWLAVAILLAAQAAAAAGNTPRVAILPLVAGDDPLSKKEDPANGYAIRDAASDQLMDKLDGEAIGAYLQGHLRDYPGVEWVERTDLAAMLAEAEMNMAVTSDASAITVGRMLKADLVIHGVYPRRFYDDPATRDIAHRRVLIEVTDLDNASVLASEIVTIDSLNMADASDLTPAVLARCAETARRLLATALEARKKAAGAVTLAPLFFTNLGSDARLDSWPGTLMNEFSEVSASFPGTAILHFPGTEVAEQEQGLSLLGITDADPNLWRTAAKGYVWGAYHEIPPSVTTAFQDIQVQAELFLKMGAQEPKRFTRTFSVGDFDKESRALIEDVLREAAASKDVAPSPDAGKQMAEAIFDHLCETINAGFFSKKPDLARVIPDGLNLIQYAGQVIGPVLAAPSGDQRLEYCQHMMDLACFFEPENARFQLLRTLLSSWEWTRTPDDQLTPLAVSVPQLERLVQDPNYDPALFASAAEFIINRYIPHKGNDFFFATWESYERGSDGFERSKKTVPPEAPAERDRLMSEFYPVLIAQTPVMIKKLDEAGASKSGRSNAAGWLRAVLEGNVNPEIKFQFFKAVWPLVGADYGPRLDKLLDGFMVELGDRARVQAILVKSAAAAPQASPAEALAAGAATPRVTQWMKPPFPGAKHTFSPRWRTVQLPFERLIPATPMPMGQTSFRYPDTVLDLQVFGDRLLLQANVGRAFGVWLSYRLSTGQLEPVDAVVPDRSGPPGPGFSNGMELTPGGRLLYERWDAPGGIDLLSDMKQDFSLADGLPLAAPTMMGYGGNRYAVVADETKRTVGLFDWASRTWLTPPPPPPGQAANGPAPAGHIPWNLQMRMPLPPIAGSEGAIVFPQWNLLYDTAAQSWENLPPLPQSPETAPRWPGVPIGWGGEGSLVLDGEVWRWNGNGILDFSRKERRIVWQSQELRISAVAPDGQYLWLLAGASLALLDRASHETLGVIGLSAEGLAANVRCHFRMDEYDCWVTTPMGGMLHCEKAELYAALGIKPPSPSRGIESLLRPGETALPILLYDAILRDDLQTADRLLEKPGAADTVLGRSETPALTVAVWTRDLELVKLFLKHHPTIDATPKGDAAPAGASPPSGWAPFASDATPLTEAAREPDPAMTRLLLQAGATPSSAALRAAVSEGNTPVAELLVRAGAPMAGVVDEIARQIDADAPPPWLAPGFGPSDAAVQARLKALSGNPALAEAFRSSNEKFRKTSEAARESLAERRQNDVDMAARLLALNPALSEAERGRLEELAGRASAPAVPLAPAEAANLPHVCDLIRAALHDNNDTRAVALTQYIPPEVAASSAFARDQWNFRAVRSIFIDSLRARSAPTVEALLRRGVSPDPAGDEMVFVMAGPLIEALDHVDMVSLLLQHGAQIPLADRQKALYIERVVESSNGLELLPLVLPAYPDLKRKIGYGTVGGTVLCAACSNEPPKYYLMRASEEDREKVLQTFLSMGVSPSVPGRDGETPLHVACASGQAMLACLLAGSGADINQRDLAGRTALDPPCLSQGSDGEFLEKLQSYQPASEVEKQGKQRLLDAIHARPTLSDLRDAVNSGDLASVNDLLEREAALSPPLDAAHPEEAGKPGLVFLAVTRHFGKITETLLAHGCDPNIGEGGVAPWKPRLTLADSPRPSPQVRCKTPLIAAVEAGDTAMVKLLLDYGAYAPAEDQFHRNAIDAAATPDLAQFIQQNTKTQFYAEELFRVFSHVPVPMPSDAQAYSATYDRIARSAPNAFYICSSQGVSPAALALGDDYVIALIHKCGIRLTALDHMGMNPLHHAVVNGDSRQAADLVQLGFDPSVPDARGMTALDLAQSIYDDSERASVLKALNTQP